jgi:hypothetical protein
MHKMIAAAMVAGLAAYFIGVPRHLAEIQKLHGPAGQLKDWVSLFTRFLHNVKLQIMPAHRIHT